MAAIQYIARRNLAPNHVYGGQYTVEFKAIIATPTVEVNNSQLVSLGGHTETTFFDAREIWQIKSQPQTPENTAFLREAVYSMLDGQVVNANLLSDEFSGFRAVLVGPPIFERLPGTTDRLSFSFSLRAEP